MSADGYPALNPAALAAMADRYVTIVSLSHPEGLTEAQLAEVILSVAAQLKATEALRQFTLGNSDEPAFVMPQGPELCG